MYKISIAKFLLTMKLTVILLLVVLLQVKASIYAQKVSISVKNASIEEILNGIKSQTNYDFLYNDDVLKTTKPISLNIVNVPLKDALNLCFKGLEIDFTIIKTTVLLKIKDKPIVVPIPVSGKVVNEKGLPVSGVSIKIKGTTSGTLTNENGEYRINVPDKSAILIFSSIGFITVEKQVLDGGKLNVILKDDNQDLNEIVVVGYGTVKKKDLTGAVASLDNTKQENLPNTNITQALRGTLAGVSIVAGGNAGSGSGINVRGTNSISANGQALIVVDGIIFNGALGDLNPSDIATVDVLKDASSAAIFGAKSSNGVVLITTKRGTTAKPSIQFNSYYGLQSFLMTQDLETPDQYIAKKLNYQKTLAFRGVAPDPVLSDPARYLNPDEMDNYNNRVTTDAFKLIAQTAPIQEYNLSIGANTNKTNYFISGSWTDQKGRVQGDGFKRASVRLKLETQITDWLKFGTNSTLSYVDVSNSPANLASAFAMSPYAHYYLDDAKTILDPNPMTDGLVSNPLLPLLNQVINTRRDLSGIFYGEINAPFLPGLTYRFTYSNNIITSKNYAFTPSFNAGGLNRISSLNNNLSETQDMHLENLLKYNRTFSKDHNIDVTLLYDYNSANNNSLTAAANDFPSEALTYYGLSTGLNQANGAGFSDYHAIAMMARINYKYKDKYLLTLTDRRDGASLFSKNNKYAYFPSAALGWLISEESFMKKFSMINFLKLRVSYGANGNQAINRYQSLSKFDNVAGYSYLFDGVTAVGIAQTSLGNPDLKWESTYASNFGLDYEILNNRIRGSIDVYHAVTKDLLLARNIPTLNGFSSILSNLGQINNTGVEFAIHTINVQNDNFEWTTGFNIAHNRNKIVHLYGKRDASGKELDDITNGWFIGKSLDAYYNYITDGIWQIGDDIPTGFRPGDFKIKDLNGDGKITPDADRTIIGYNRPDFTYGFTSNFRYKQFNLYTQISGSYGGLRNNSDILNPNIQFISRVRGQNIDWWNPENQSATHPSMDYQNSFSVNFLESFSYLRIQDISLSYDFTKPVLTKLHMDKLQVYASAKNPFLFSNWSGWDPETTGSGRSQYPTMKSFTIGVRLGL